MPRQRVLFRTIPFSKIHKEILESCSLSQAAKKIGIGRDTLSRKLVQFMLNGSPITFERLKEMDIDAMRQLYGQEYDKPWKVNSFYAFRHPFSYIHQKIIDSTTNRMAAISLGMEVCVLSRYLKSFEHEGIQLSIDRLRLLDKHTMREFYGSYYDEYWEKNRIALHDKLFSDIHQVILQTFSDTQAAAELGITLNTLRNYLSKFIHEGTPLSIDGLRAIDVETMKKIYGSYYNHAWVGNQILIPPAVYSNKRQKLDSLPLTDPSLSLEMELMPQNWVAYEQFGKIYPVLISFRFSRSINNLKIAC